MSWRSVRLLVISVLCVPGLAAEPRLVLTHPDAAWSLRADLPGFDLQPPWIFRDRSQVWAEATNRPSGVLLTVFIARVSDARSADGCRKYYGRMARKVGGRRRTYERGEMALTEYAEELRTGEESGRVDLHGYLYREGFCVDAHVSKDLYRREDEPLLLPALDALRLEPSTQEQRSRVAGYSLGDPEEAMFLEAAQKIRAGDPAGADGVLSAMCPWETGGVPSREMENSPACSLRTVSRGEARGAANGKDLGGMYWRVGEMLRQEGKLDAARAILEKSLELDSADVSTWYALGMVHRERKDLDAAEAAFRRALGIDPDDVPTLYWMSTNLMEMGKLDEADAMLDHVLRADPKEVRVWFRRGQVQMKRGAYDKAIESFEKAKSLGVDPRMVREKIQECREALARR